MDIDADPFPIESVEREYRRYTGSEKWPIKLLAIRGYRISMGIPDRNDVDIYDDAIIVAMDGKTTNWSASTDPGRYYIKNPMNPNGCASLQCGLWWFGRGQHLGNHWAFIQSREVAVDRLDKNGEKIKSEKGFFGINLHSGGPAYQVGKYSAGCQIIRCPEGAWGATWVNFEHSIYQAMKRFKLSEIPYLLVDRLLA